MIILSETAMKGSGDKQEVEVESRRGKNDHVNKWGIEARALRQTCVTEQQTAFFGAHQDKGSYSEALNESS